MLSDRPEGQAQQPLREPAASSSDTVVAIAIAPDEIKPPPATPPAEETSWSFTRSAKDFFVRPLSGAYRSTKTFLTSTLPDAYNRHRHKIAPIESGIGKLTAGSAALSMLGLDLVSAGSISFVLLACNVYVQHKHITKRISRMRDNRSFEAPTPDEKQTCNSNLGKSAIVIVSSTGEATSAGVKTFLETNDPYLASFAAGINYVSHTTANGQSCFELEGQTVQRSLAGRVAQFIGFDYALITRNVFDFPEFVALNYPAYQGALQLFSNNACLDSYGVTNPLLRLPLAFVGGLPLAASQFDINAGLEQHIMMKSLGERAHKTNSLASWLSYGAQKFAWGCDRIMTCSTDLLQKCGVSPATQTHYFNLIAAGVKGMATAINGTRNLLPIVPYYIAAPIGGLAYIIAQNSNEHAARAVGLDARLEKRYGTTRVDDRVSAAALASVSVLAAPRPQEPNLPATLESKVQLIELTEEPSNFPAVYR